MPLMKRLLVTLIAVLHLAAALDTVDPYAPAAYFATTTSTNATYVVAMNFVQNGDIYIHMHSSTSCSWFGVGFGYRMDGAGMVIGYKASNGTGVITSVRRASHGHSEPVAIAESQDGPRWEPIFVDDYAPNANTAVKGGIQISHGVCRNCSSFGDMRLDYTSRSQPFIYAIGPDNDLDSNDLNAPLRRHAVYGHFTMDMTVATTNASSIYGRVPAPNLEAESDDVADSLFATEGAHGPLGEREDSNWALPVHAAMMSLAFILLFPLGALVLRWFQSVVWHGVSQTVGVLLVIIGLGMGANMSHQYNRTRDFSSSHQVLGLVLFAALSIQLGLGIVHHAIYRRTKQPTILGKIHLFLGPILILLALINGGLGFNLAHNPNGNIPYGVVVAVVGLIFISIRLWLFMKRRPAAYRPDRDSLEAYKTFGPGYRDMQTPVSAGSAAQHFGFEMSGVGSDQRPSAASAGGPAKV